MNNNNEKVISNKYKKYLAFADIVCLINDPTRKYTTENKSKNGGNGEDEDKNMYIKTIESRIFDMCVFLSLRSLEIKSPKQENGYYNFFDYNKITGEAMRLYGHIDVIKENENHHQKWASTLGFLCKKGLAISIPVNSSKKEYSTCFRGLKDTFDIEVIDPISIFSQLVKLPDICKLSKRINIYSKDKASKEEVKRIDRFNKDTIKEQMNRIKNRDAGWVYIKPKKIYGKIVGINEENKKFSISVAPTIVEEFSITQVELFSKK